ncbi:hypothetical protein [Streptomyces sp. NPDC057682]|uniref:hypothetical protein n=1 Tax=Streptomyces sp. NPDC057682 TaxID=3346210 RepID=UPI0036905FC5
MWFEQAEEAERAQDWDTAIALVSARAECYSDDHNLHGNHLWHMDLLAGAGRFPELTELARTDPHARRRLNRALRDRRMEPALRRRAEQGDRDALYVFVRLLCTTDRVREARLAVQEIAPDNAYALGIVESHRPG